MTPSLNVARWDLPRLTAEWRAARPFAHVVVDELLPAPSLQTLCQALAAEPHWPNRGEIYDMMGSGDELGHPTLRAFHQSFAAPDALAAVAAVSGKAPARVEMRSYAYLPGHYLLPHTDCRTGMGRLVAYAYYAWVSGVDGGELELFDCALDGTAVVSARPSLRIEPRTNRLVLFDVTPASLHQVREVLSGARLSLSGWFYA
jgi:hypothetical protein